MAQGDTRPKPSRHGSRNVRLAGDTDTISLQTQQKLEGNRKDTIRYIKRVLCDQPAKSNTSAGSSGRSIDSTPLDELLPPLTSSNEVDIQLYAIIAVILNQFVQSWYNRITPDQEFVGQVVQIIAHCTRGIEQRLRLVDLEELLLDEFPALMVAHVDAVTVAQDACSNDRSQNEVRMVYHSINPNKALTPLPDTPSNVLEQQDNEIAWSQLLVARILPLVLPPEDLQNPCLHVLVSEIFSEMIVHNAICGKASEPWVLWEGVTKLIHATLRPDSPRQGLAEAASSINKLEQFGLLSTAKAKRGEDLHRYQHSRVDAIAQVFWSSLQVLSMVWLLLRSLAWALMHESSIPARSTRGRKAKTSHKLSVTAVEPANRPDPQQGREQACDKRPVVSLRIWSCIRRLSSLEYRMPWLCGFLSLLQWFSLNGPGKVCRTNGVLDRLMSSKINTILSRPGLLPKLLLAIRGAIFPDNALAPARPTPTSAQVTEMKRQCANAIVETIPGVVRSRYFATKDQDLMRQDVESTLDLLADAYINKHLIVGAVELLVVRLFPELGEEVAED